MQSVEVTVIPPSLVALPDPVIVPIAKHGVPVSVGITCSEKLIVAWNESGAAAITGENSTATAASMSGCSQRATR